LEALRRKVEDMEDRVKMKGDRNTNVEVDVDIRNHIPNNDSSKRRESNYTKTMDRY
jgi:hypothetical protein